MKKSELIEIVEEVKAGNTEAFEELYDEYYDRLYFFVLKNVNSKEAAEDITQESFLRSLEKIQSLENSEHYVTWLHSIAFRKCKDLFRSTACDAYFDTDEEMEAAMENVSLNEPIMVPEDYAVDKDRARQLKEMIDSLKPDMRSAVILYYYEDMSLAQVAKVLGMNENAAKQKLFQARKKLKSKIDKLTERGVLMAAVPVREMLCRTISPKHAAALAGRGAGRAVSSGLMFGKVAGISAAAVLAIGVPLALATMGKDKNDIKGDARMFDSSAYMTLDMNNDSSISSQEIVYTPDDSQAAEDTSNAAEINSKPEKRRPESSEAEISLPDETVSEAEQENTMAVQPADSTAAVSQTSAVVSETEISSAAPVSADSTADTTSSISNDEPREMSVDKMISMTPREILEYNNDNIHISQFRGVGGVSVICDQFPEYEFFVNSTDREAYENFAENKDAIDEDYITEIRVSDGVEIGSGAYVGMDYNTLKSMTTHMDFFVDTTETLNFIGYYGDKKWRIVFLMDYDVNIDLREIYARNRDTRAYLEYLDEYLSYNSPVSCAAYYDVVDTSLYPEADGTRHGYNLMTGEWE